ncbi:MAG TPA: penicillin-binding protein 2 [Polyangia bacterium]
MEIAGQDAELPEMRRRAKFFALITLVVFGAIAGRLFYLQVVEGDSFYRLTSDSIVRTEILPAVRGQIRDRKGRVLATVRPSYNLYVTPRLLTSEAFARLRMTLGMNGDEAMDVWERVQGTAAGDAAPSAREKERPVLLAEDISREAMAAIETGLEIPGIKIVSVPRRSYPQGALAAHVLGFMNEISADELRAKKDEGYRAGDLIGRTGIERQWEGYLRGRAGFQKIVLDRRGLPKPDIHEITDGPTSQPAVPGNHLVLTLDADVQRITERALRSASAAAAVVLDVDTGRVLAMVSKPGFDPNEMSGHLTPDAEQRILTDRFHPLRDKTLTETYFPGSTFKAVSALAALEDQLVTPEERTKCHGYYEIGRRRFHCTKTHGVVALYDAIVQSCNVYFYELGARPGMMDRLAKYAADLGLGAPTGIGINGEEGGFVPTEAWYREQKRENPKSEGFQVGHALNAVIGQGSTRVTLVQMAALYAAIANGGKLWLPQIVDHVEAPDGQILEEFPPRVRREIAVSPENLAFVRQALVGVVNEPKGTAFKVRSKEIEIAGKTGTAQVHGRHADSEGSYEGTEHAWFVGFAPAGRPRIALAVLVEHGGHGGEVAAPLAVEIVNNYFDTVAPADKNAPHLGLPRRRGGIVPMGEEASAPAPPRKPRVAEPDAASEPEAPVPAAPAAVMAPAATVAPAVPADAPAKPTARAPAKPRAARAKPAPLGEAPPMRLDFSVPDKPEPPQAEEAR